MEGIIAAIATGLTPAGIGIVRVSGDGAGPLCEKVLRLKSGRLTELRPRCLWYGRAVDGEETLDEILAVYMPAPHSFTGEDTVEIQCHGGPHLMRRILESVLKAGARLAGPGEFSERAFLNGRLDLAQAEAVKSLIEAENDYARRSALRQLEGKQSRLISSLKAEILEMTAWVEAALDDPEHYSLEQFPAELTAKLNGWIPRLEELIRRSEGGRLLAEGVRAVILGRPNVGKSSLLNMLLGEDRAIVTAVPGTTRDTLDETLRLGDILLRISDTAGIREGAGEIEQIGIGRALKKAEEADLILFLFDRSEMPAEEDRELISRFPEKKSLVLLNKSDLPAALSGEGWAAFLGRPVISVSARTGEGFDLLEERISGLFCFGELRADPVTLTGVRHKRCLEETLSSLLRTRAGLAEGVPEDLLTIDLMDACRFLGEILGEDAGEDLIGEIFSKFCMGK